MKSENEETEGGTGLECHSSRKQNGITTAAVTILYLFFDGYISNFYIVILPIILLYSAKNESYRVHESGQIECLA
jgi:hypothetical protein